MVFNCLFLVFYTLTYFILFWALRIRGPQKMFRGPHVAFGP